MIKALIIATLTAAGAMLLFAAHGRADVNVLASQLLCSSRYSAVRMVREMYGEKEMYKGQLSASKMRIFVNPSTKTFTIFVDRGGSKLCMLAAGGAWDITIDGEDL